MDNHQLKINIKKIRAVENADVILDGITVIAGENGCGKSTISKLTYHLIKTSLDFDSIVDEKLKSGIMGVYRTLEQLSKELPYFLDTKEHQKFRNSLRKINKDNLQLNIFGEYLINDAIDFLIERFRDISNIENNPKISNRINRIKLILMDSLNSEERNLDADIVALLKKLKEIIVDKAEKAILLKEARPTSILYDALDEAFYDNPIADTYNITEYGVPIIDTNNKKIVPLHTVQNVAYIDTPMIFGIGPNTERTHWDDINSILKKKGSKSINDDIEQIFKNDILKGEVNHVEDNFPDKSFVYERKDGSEFDLLECATGLKSFAILQILFKNGFLNKKSLLIVDEPEAHLHPQWVVEYARLIVMLHKNIGVKFLIASHHPDMISAIKYISEKENIGNNIHFYLAEKAKIAFTYNYKDLGTDIDDIFSSFNIAFERIDLYGKTE